jgi:Tol biopolymer transport system component
MTSAHWSPVGNWIEFDRLNTDESGHTLYLIHPNGSGLKQITFSLFDGFCCGLWSPDGKKLLTKQTWDGYLVSMNWNGSGVKRITLADAKHGDAEYAWGR